MQHVWTLYGSVETTLRIHTELGMAWHSQAHILQLWESSEGNSEDFVHGRQTELISCNKEVKEHGVQGLHQG